jgi:hypothetical protein
MSAKPALINFAELIDALKEAAERHESAQRR